MYEIADLDSCFSCGLTQFIARIPIKTYRNCEYSSGYIKGFALRIAGIISKVLQNCRGNLNSMEILTTTPSPTPGGPRWNSC